MDISLERYRKRRALLILMLVPLLALGLWNLRALRHPAGTPVSPQETTAHHVILVPLDGRPPCRQFVIDAGRIGGTEVVTPPHELQDYYSQPGDTKAMRRWLLEEVAKGTTDAVFLSVDQLLYGGLLTAREKQATSAEVEEFLAFLRELHEANPAVPIYAFSILPRLTPQDTIDGYDERRDIMAYSRLAGRQAAGLPVDETKLAALKAKIPPASLERYLAHFRENATLNERLIDLTHEGTLTRLVLGQDDGEEYGIPNIEKYALLDYIKSLGLSDRQVFLTHGADEIALSLLAAWHNEQTGYAPKIFVAYNDPGARDRVMPYMAVSTGVCTEEKIRLTGGSLAASPEEADFTLLVSTNDTDKDTLWSRGQAWAIYGYTMVYRYTHEKRFLDFAQKVTTTSPRGSRRHSSTSASTSTPMRQSCHSSSRPPSLSTICSPTQAGTRRATPSARRLPRPASTVPRWKQ